jgi:selenium-binding protein 1
MPAHPDPTFHASAKLAMQAPPEKLAYTVMLSPDFSRPDALAVVDLDPGSKSLGKIVHTLISPIRATNFTILAGTLAHRRCLRLQATLSWSGVT